MGLEQDSAYPMIFPEITRFGGFKYSDSLLDLVEFDQKTGAIITKTSDCKNVYWRDGALLQIDGTEKYESTVIAGAPTVGGLFVYGQETSGTKYVIATTGTKVWRYDGADWVDITDVYTVTGTQHFGLTFNNIFIGVTSDRSAPYKISGTANIAALGGSPPSGKVLGRIGEFIVIGNTAANKSYAYYCDPGNPESGWDKFWDVKSDDTQGLTAVGELDQRTGYLFKEFTADRIEHLGGVSFQHDFGYLPVGIVAQATLKKCTAFIDGKGVKGLVGLSDDGVYVFDSSPNPYKISGDIEFKFDRNNPLRWNRAQWSKAHATYDPTRHWYWLWVPSSSSAGQMDELWICDLTTFEWWPCDPDASASGCMIEDSNSNPQMHVGGYDGYVRKFSKSVRSFDSVAIDSYYGCGVIDFKKTVRLRQFIPYAAQAGTWDLDFDLRWGLSAATSASDALTLTAGGGVYGTGTYGSATYGTGKPVFKNLAALNFTGRYLQIYLGNGNAAGRGFSLRKIDLPCRIIGGRTGDYR